MMKVMHWLVQHNIATSLFEPLIELIVKIDSAKIKKVRIAKNATHTSTSTANEFVDSMADVVRQRTVSEMNSSPNPYFGLMLDEGSSAVAVRKMLGISVKFIGSDGNPSVKYLATKEVVDGKAQTMVDTVKSTFQAMGITSWQEKLRSLGTDGASVMLGRKEGVGAKLAQQCKGLITVHCNNHRLALAARDSFKGIPEMIKIEEFLSGLYNFFHWSPNRSNSLRAVQEAFNEAPLAVKAAKHFR
jgi:hypothetical protein